MKRHLKPTYHKALKLRDRLLQGNPVLVLMYHRIDDQVDGPLAKLTVSKDSFEQQLIYFREKYQVLRLTDDWSGRRKTGLVLTFDDGYAQSLLDALPLLEKYNIPATLFITTQNLNTNKEFWWDRLTWDYSQCDEWFNMPDRNVKVSKKEYTYRDVSNFLSKFKNEDKDKWLSDFEEANGLSFTSRASYQVLTYDELEKLANHRLIDIGLHTHHHYFLGDLDHQEQIDELSLSIAHLNKVVPNYVNFLALPHGSFNEETLKATSAMGIGGILLANDHYSSPGNKKSKKINRILMPDVKGKKLKDYLRKFEFTLSR